MTTRTLWACAVALATETGCGEVKTNDPDAPPTSDATVTDGLSTSDATVTDGPWTACDPRGVFDPPVTVMGLEALSVALTPRLTADERTVYLSGSLAGEPFPDLYRATRSTRSGRFDVPRKLAPSSSADAEYYPTVSADERTLLFSAHRGSTADPYRLYVASRSSPLVEFEVAAPLTGVGSPVATDEDVSALFTNDDQELWFASDRAGGAGGFDLWRAVRAGAGFANPTHVPALSSASGDFAPTLSVDRLTIYFTSERAGGAGGEDVWAAHRESIDVAFAAPSAVSELNSAAQDVVGWISPDNCRVYLHSSRSGAFQLFVAERRP